MLSGSALLSVLICLVSCLARWHASSPPLIRMHRTDCSTAGLRSPGQRNHGECVWSTWPSPLTCTQAHLIDTTIDLQLKTMPSHIVWMVGSTTCDIVITVCMVYYVSSVAASAEILPDHRRRYAQLSKGRQGLASDALISRLMRLTVETGALTASIACLDLVFFTTFRHNNLHMTPSVLVLVLITRITLLTDAYNCRALVLTKVYTNTLLMLVNNRARMRQMMMEQDEGPISIPLQWAADPSDLDTPNLDTHPRPRSASLPAVISWNVHDSGVSIGEDHALDVMDVSKDVCECCWHGLFRVTLTKSSTESTRGLG